MTLATDELALSVFHPLVRQWFIDRFAEPTGVQRAVWPRVAAGEHVLATAPTGSGKTLAAFLWAIDQLASGRWTGGQVRVLYISPLRALNNDVGRNLLEPLREMRSIFATAGEPFAPIQVAVRSGDTEPAQRRRMLSRPPEILITTPESLNLLISSRSGRRILGGVQSVILDEIHAVAGVKRGVFLMTAIERLTLLSGEFQRIALSATVEPLDTIARFVGGYRGGPAAPESNEPRPVSIVRATDRKKIEMSVAGLPKLDPTQQTFWPVVARELLREIDPSQSTLVFVNNRRLSERLCHLLNETAGRTIAYSHHGAMSREVRALVEQRLKQGALAALVATSSLELGIDIGSVEKVLLVQTPRSLNGAIQRVGRAGHRVGATSRARLFPTHSADLLDAAVFAPYVRDQRPQALRPVNNPLDVLAQVCVAMCGVEPWKPDELYAFIRTVHSYHGLTRRAFDLVVQMLQGRYADARIGALRPRLSLDESGRLVARDGALSLVYTSGGVIPDRGYFNVRVNGSRAVLGQLDEEFVWERRIGDQFRIGMQSWRIERITHNDVEVGPGGSAQAGMPFWRGDSEDRDFTISERIALFRERADLLLLEKKDSELREILQREHALDEAAADDLIDYLRRQRGATGTSLPHRHHLLIEHVRETGGHDGHQQLIIHAGWGGSVLRPWAIALAAAWQKRFGVAVDVLNDDQCLLIELPGEASADELISLVTPEAVEPLLRTRLESTGFFGARFRENAGRALLLPRLVRRRMPLWLNRMRAKKLQQQVSRYPDFPIIAETWRECLEDHFELDRLRAMLEELQNGTIRVSEAHTAAPSPFCAGLVWKSTNQQVYESDRPYDASASSLSEQTLREVLHDAELRPRIPEPVIKELRARLQRTLSGYAPSSAEELADLVNERLAVPESQWAELCAAVRQDHPDTAEGTITEASERLVNVRLPGAAQRLIVARERLPRLLCACEVALQGSDPRTMGGSPLEAAAFEALEINIESWHPPGEADARSLLLDVIGIALSFEGPLTMRGPHEQFGVDPERLEPVVEELVESGRVVSDVLRADGAEIEFCDAENLERLLRMLRTAHRKPFAARPLAELPLLLATLQGLVPRGNSSTDLQDRLSTLFGYSANAGLWEMAILPARMATYRTADLDALLAGSELTWLGAGEGELLFSFRSELDLFTSPRHEKSTIIPEARGRYEFDALREQVHLPPAELTQRLWQESWRGLITNDGFAAVRRGVEGGFEPKEDARPVRVGGRSRMRFRDWHAARIAPGNWYAVPQRSEEPDRLDKLEADKDRVRQALSRYGVLFRDLLSRETRLFQWSRLQPALRLMELSGEVVAGQFFADLPGLQFASPEAIRLLQAGLDADAVYWMNAADPAAPTGLGLAAFHVYPARQAASTLVYHGTRLVLILRRNGREAEVRVPPEDAQLPRYLHLLQEQLAREFSPARRIEVELINDEPAPTSPYAEIFKSIGFSSDYKALTLYRKF